jgi:phosphoribosylamine-glycine ligase
MPKSKSPPARRPNVMVFGVGSFAHSLARTLQEAGADVSTYLTRNYGHFRRNWPGRFFPATPFPIPVPLLARRRVDVVIPQSIDWAQAPWAGELEASGVGVFGPTGEAMKIERERDYAENCARIQGFRFPRLAWRRIVWRRK